MKQKLKDVITILVLCILMAGLVVFVYSSNNDASISYDIMQGLVRTTCENGKLIRTTKYTTSVIGDCK